MKNQKKTLRRVLLLSVAGLVALLVVGRLAVMLFSQPALPPLPNPNGYDDLLKAAQAVSGNLEDVAKRDRDDLRGLIATNSEALRLLRIGLSRECSVPTDAFIANFSTASRDLGALKSLARLLSAEGWLAELEDRPGDAAQSYLDSIRLGVKMSRGGLLINRLVGIACEAMGSSSLVKILPKLSCEQMRPFSKQLEQLDAESVTWSEISRNEDRFTRAQIGNYPNPIRYLSDLWDSRGARKASLERHHLAAARLRLMAVELALRSYRCDESKSPTELSLLSAKYLERIPTDPFSNRSLIYKSTGTNWIIYSVGPDQVDDGGKPITKNKSGFVSTQSGDSDRIKGDVFLDSRW